MAHRSIKCKETHLHKPELWCGYYLTISQKKQLLIESIKQFDLSVKDRLRPFQLIELVRHMVRK